MTALKGIIALDIDGTITVSKQALDLNVQTYLNHLIQEGWRIIFLTGRTFSFAWPILAGLQGNFFLAVQNGASLYEMPEIRCVKKNYLLITQLSQLEPIFKSRKIGMLIESGKENGDICYFNHTDFSPPEKEYLSFRMQISQDKWEAVNSFSSLPILDFAAAKYFATEKQGLQLAEDILKKLPLNVMVISDPFRLGFHLAHVTAANASKGAILESFMAKESIYQPVIVAGDDYNDVDMLEKGTVRILMENGPSQLHKLAHIIAPPAERQGIIQGLQEAIWKVSSE